MLCYKYAASTVTGSGDALLLFCPHCAGDTVSQAAGQKVDGLVWTGDINTTCMWRVYVYTFSRTTQLACKMRESRVFESLFRLNLSVSCKSTSIISVNFSHINTPCTSIIYKFNIRCSNMNSFLVIFGRKRLRCLWLRSKCLVQKCKHRFRKFCMYKYSAYFHKLQISHLVLKYELVSRDFWSIKVEVCVVVHLNSHAKSWVSHIFESLFGQNLSVSCKSKSIISVNFVHINTPHAFVNYKSHTFSAQSIQYEFVSLDIWSKRSWSLHSTCV